MSVELLVLLAVFVLLPLVQRLLAGAAERGAGAQGKPMTRPELRAGEAPRPPEARPSPFALSPMPPAVPHEAVGATIQAVGAAGAAQPSVMPRRNARERHPVSGRLDRVGLRRAMVLMAIFGPCRAISPHR